MAGPPTTGGTEYAVYFKAYESGEAVDSYNCLNVSWSKSPMYIEGTTATLTSGIYTATITNKPGWVINSVTKKSGEPTVSVLIYKENGNDVVRFESMDILEPGAMVILDIDVTEIPAYLDRSGFAYLWSKCKAELDKKVDKTS